jgi:Tfp pilus assembly protein PilF
LKPAELQAKRPASNAQGWQTVCVCVFLALAALAVFGQTAGFGFVNYDDVAYVYENPRLAGGLSLDGLAWAFAHAECYLYHPLTMISLRLDYQLHGLHAGGYHLANVLIHTASALLLFLLLRRMTGALWRSAFVAAVFAIHPLRAESVAWVSERKDVLATFFFLLTVASYVRYVRNPNSLARYLQVVVFFGLGLLCKPVAVTLPFVLLLLDWWPLNRFGLGTPNRGCDSDGGGKGRAGSPVPAAARTERAPCQPRPMHCSNRVFGIPRRLILEKIPLVALAAVMCVVTYLVVRKVELISAPISFPVRMGNAGIACVVYLRQLVWPAGLAVFYPFPVKSPPLWEIAGAFLLLAVISGGVLAFWRTRPWLSVGWFWYLGMLVPVIGIVGAGDFAHADRNTCLPQIGLAVLLTWAVADGSAGWKHRRLVLGGLMVAVVGALMVCAHIQTSYWRDSESLWNRALDCNPDNSVARINLGNAYYAEGDWEAAGAQYRKAMEVKPEDAEARNDLGIVLVVKGDREEAIAQFRKALELKPDYAEARLHLANVLFAKGNQEEAIAEFRKVLETKPDYPEARLNLGDALFTRGNLEEAIAQYRKAVEIKPDFAEALGNLGGALFMKGQTAEAMRAWQKSLEIKPGQPSVQNELAWLLAATPDAALRDGAKAVALATQASQSSGGGNPAVLRTLAAAYAEEANFGAAAATARRALELAARQKQDALAAALQREIKLYEANTPLREAPR